MYELHVVSEDQFGAAAVDLLRDLAAGACLGLPTGHTPLPVYAELRRLAAAGLLVPGRWRVVMLDDYYGGGEPSFHTWLGKEVITPLAIADDRYLRIPTLPGGFANIAAACDDFESRLRVWGGCDWQLLGLGANGHIGFNEPGSARDSRTRLVTLTAATARANAEYWPQQQPPQLAVTQGIGTILEARRIALLVRGADKAAILAAALQGPITPAVPASFLQLAPALVVVADTAAAARLASL